MIMFPSMLVDAAKEASMKTPEASTLDDEYFDPHAFPHFTVFCTIQLGRAMTSWTEHWDNAKIIAQIPDDEIKTVTLFDLAKKGVQGLPQEFYRD